MRGRGIGPGCDRGCVGIAAAGALALALFTSDARAQVPGENVRIETASGTFTGMLLDRLPSGYLVRLPEGTQVIPYASVIAIGKLDTKPAPSTPSTPSPPPPPVVVVLPPAAPPYAAPSPYPTPPPISAPPRVYHPGSPVLLDLGRVLLGAGILGLVTGAVLAPVGAVAKDANTCHDATGNIHFQCEYGNGSSLLTAGLVTLGASAGVTVGGILLMVTGTTWANSASHAVPAVPTIRVAPRGATLTWTF